MQTSSVQEIVAQADRLRMEAATALKLLMHLEAPGGSKLDIQLQVPGAYTSIAEMDARILGLCALVNGFQKHSPEKLLLLPTNHLSGMPAEMAAIATSLQGMTQNVSNILSAEGAVGAIELSTFTLRSHDGERTVQLAELLTLIEKQIDAALDRAHRIGAIITPKSYDAFAGAVASLAQFLEQLSLMSQTARDELAAIVADRKAAASAAKTASDKQALAIESAEGASGAAENIRNNKSKIEELLASVDEISSKASALKRQVDEYSPRFTEFDERMTERSAAVASGLKTQSDLIAKLSAQEAAAKTIIANAKDALQWGTAEGLSKSFATSASELDVPLESAVKALHWSFVLLGVWVLLVFLVPQLIEPSLAILRVPDKLEGWSAFAYLLSSVAIRLAIVSPAIFFTLFANNRYRAIFAARELYTFKKTVAAAIPGFKEQAAAADADEHVKAMTAAAFERLLFNPKDTSSDSFGPPRRLGFLSRWLVGLIKKAFEDSAQPAK